MNKSRIAGISLIAAMFVGAATATAQHMFADFGGIWNVTVEGPQGAMNSQLNLKQSSDSVSGQFESELGSSPVAGTAKGDTLRLGFSIDAGGQMITIQAVGVLKNKSSISGSMDVAGMGSFPFNATKKQ